MNHKEIIDLLKAEMLPAMGCTEPGAAALAGAKAAELFGDGPIEEILVFASRDMIKNAMDVGLPGCSLKGIISAALLGVCKKDSSRGLSTLSDISPEEVEKVSSMNARLELVDNVPSLYVSVRIEGPENHYSLATISLQHDVFSRLEVDGNVLENRENLFSEKTKEQQNVLDSLTLEKIVKFADTVNVDDVSFIDGAIRINSSIAEHAIDNNYGLQVGKTSLEALHSKPESLSEAYMVASSYAAAGSDARMSGCTMPVIINSGSGNQGITVTVPVSIVADCLGVTREKKIRAVCISELVGLMLTARKSRLSALCGAFTASIGTACAYVYLQGGSVDVMNDAINTMVGNLTGIICDGAKNTCALKIYTSLETAGLSVKLALKGLSPKNGSGIVGDDSTQSISSLSRIATEGMTQTDKTILSIMMGK